MPPVDLNLDLSRLNPMYLDLLRRTTYDETWFDMSFRLGLLVVKLLLCFYSFLALSNVFTTGYGIRCPTFDFASSLVNVLFRVENNGFEPLTPCLQSRCSSQLS